MTMGLLIPTQTLRL